jgi:XTP/dITP diphosphohydrolase
LASDPPTVLLATRSTHKAREIRAILTPAAPGITFLTLDDAGITPTPEEDDIEAFLTFTENALAKARYFAARSGLPTLADDSGIRVDALDGRPGVFSKRFSGRSDLSGTDLDRANNRAVLDALRAINAARRDAHYICAAALVAADGPALLTLGSSSGVLLETPRGDGGFGYDPLFLVPDLGLTFGQLPAHEKNARSHRGRAFRALATLFPALSFPS